MLTETSQQQLRVHCAPNCMLTEPVSNSGRVPVFLTHKFSPLLKLYFYKNLQAEKLMLSSTGTIMAM